MIADYEGAGEDANEFMPYGLGFKHKHLPELKTYAKLDDACRCSRRSVGNFAQGMITMVPLQLSMAADDARPASSCTRRSPTITRRSTAASSKSRPMSRPSACPSSTPRSTTTPIE